LATRIRIIPTLDRLRSVTPAAQLEARIGPSFGLPSDVYVVLAEGSDLQLLLETNERLAQRLAAEMPGLAFQPPSRLLPSAASQAQSVKTIDARHLSAGAVRASLERARVAGDFTPGAVRSVFREASLTARSEGAAHIRRLRCAWPGDLLTGSSCDATGGRSRPTCRTSGEAARVRRSSTSPIGISSSRG
jgi:hypothetical protein